MMGTIITSEPFGITGQGQEVRAWTMTNSAGMKVRILSYGCTVQSIWVPDRDGRPTDVVLGYDSLEGYEKGSCWFGAFVGRYANRIKNAAFDLNGKRYSLEKNDGNNHLHGVYSHQVFEGGAEGDSLVFRRMSPGGEEGYPGTLTLEVRYELREGSALVMDYRAWTDEDTVVNLTNHSYFNLNGSGDILDHWVKLRSGSFTQADAETLPTGRILPVEGTPMDLRSGAKLGQGIASGYSQLVMSRGYDHNFILDDADGTLRPFAEAVGDKSGIRLEAFTTQPAVQLYTGNYVDTDTAPRGKGGLSYPRYGGFCLETQHYPCSPNFPQFPSTVLHKGEEYHQITAYRFSTV